MHQITRKIYALLKIVLIISKLVSIFYLLYIVINSCFSQISDANSLYVVFFELNAIRKRSVL